MSVITFDTLSVLEKLTKDGAFTELQAKSVVDVLRDVEQKHFDIVATKKDISDSNNVKSREILMLQKDIALVRQDIKELEMRMKELEIRLTYKLTIRIYIALGAMTTFLCIALPILIKRL